MEIDPVREAEELAQSAARGTDVPVLSTHDAGKLLDAYDNWLFDCDGVLWRGGELLPGVPETLELLRSRGKRVYFVTNNSTKSRAQYLKKFTSLGIQACLEEIVPSSWAVAEYLATAHPGVKKAFVVGSAGLIDELELVGVASIGGQDPAYSARVFGSEAEFAKEATDPEVGAVVCGWDLTFNFAKLALASLYLQKNRGCVLVASNRDAFDRLGDRNMPGNGCALAAIEASVGIEAVVVGKPSHWLVERLMHRGGMDPTRTVVVGDRLDTDVMLGINGGTASVLVCTGCATLEEMSAVRVGDGRAPTYILSHVGSIAASANGNKAQR